MDCEFDAKKFSEPGFSLEEAALRLFRYQHEHNNIYGRYVALLGKNPEEVRRLEDVPFLPISFFKTHEIFTGTEQPGSWFESSGTSGMEPSRHFVRDMAVYRESFLHGFRKFYGKPSDWCIVGLLPAYLERQHSSLVAMVDALVKESGTAGSGFYLYNHEELAALLRENESKEQPTWLIGVTFALMDFAEKYPMPLRYTTVLETGGMKGRRRELTRAEVQDFLKQQWQLERVHAEYGMTELLSQAYSHGSGLFHTPPWMRVLIREEDDPFALRTTAENKPVSGGLNVIDLANIHSCAFIATEDVGRLHPGGAFEILGRMDHSDMRGCSLLVV